MARARRHHGTRQGYIVPGLVGINSIEHWMRTPSNAGASTPGALDDLVDYSTRRMWIESSIAPSAAPSHKWRQRGQGEEGAGPQGQRRQSAQGQKAKEAGRNIGARSQCEGLLTRPRSAEACPSTPAACPCSRPAPFACREANPASRAEGRMACGLPLPCVPISGR